MIGKMTGVLEEVDEDSIVLDVRDIGYIIYVSSRFLNGLPKIGDKLSVFTKLHIREDTHKLFGFQDKQERAWFSLLQNVQGVGTKLALSLLGRFTGEELSNIITLQDSATLITAPGVGKKVAERIINELKNKKLPLFYEISPETFSKDQDKNKRNKNVVPTEPLNPLPSVLEAVSALTNLGYSRDQARLALQKVVTNLQQENTEYDLPILLRLALKELVNR